MPIVIITPTFLFGRLQTSPTSFPILIEAKDYEAQHYTMLMVDAPVRDVQRDVTSHTRDSSHPSIHNPKPDVEYQTPFPESIESTDYPSASYCTPASTAPASLYYIG